MGRYKNVIILFLMMIMAIFIAGAVSGVANMGVDNSNRDIAAKTSMISLQVMEASDERFVLNMINSSQYQTDCLSGDFVLQKKDENGDWQTVETMPQTIDSIQYDLPSGENRSYWFAPVKEAGGATVLSEGEYRLCKDVHRVMEKSNEFEDLTITVEFSYPQVLSERLIRNKPVEETAHAAKLARTVLPEQAGMEDYWNPEITESDAEAIKAAGLSPKEDSASHYVKVTFPTEGTTAWAVWVCQENGGTYGPVEESK